MQSRRVRDIMAKKYATLTPDQTVASAVNTLIEYHQSAAPVIDNQRQLIGLLSEADCMRASLVEGYYNEGASPVKDFMVSTTDSISPETELSAATEFFLKKNRRLVPVVEAGTLVGILSRQNILRALVNQVEPG